jgi:hypothetical protein
LPTLTPQKAILIGFIVAPILFSLSAYFTRANRRQIIAALAASLAFGFGNLVWDQIAFRAGWWSYPAFQKFAWWLILYIPSGMVAGGAFGLIGWWITQRYGSRGLIIFILTWSIWGMIHDFGGGAAFQSSNLMVFAPGPIPVIMDGLLYATCQLLAQGTLRWVAGLAVNSQVIKNKVG